MHDWTGLKEKIRGWGKDLGFAAVGFADIDLSPAEAGLTDWLAAGCHGEMDYMASHGMKRARPAELLPGTRAVITCRMDYLPFPAPERRSASPEKGIPFGHADFCNPAQAVISRYALGRDYHKLLRARLQKLANRIAAEVGEFSYRVFTDSAPVMEVELARNAGLGWRGKHTLLLTREAGSWFFLGEICVDLPLPADGPTSGHCGDCTACLDICPTQAFVAPYRLDARRCISYLTIELKGSIPVELRPLMGNRIYGCDDCQSVCPWNRFAPLTREADFAPRHGLDNAALVELFAWSEDEFNARLAGSPIRRIGHERWLRNIAVALGNASPAPEARIALLARTGHASALVREHVSWALSRYPG
ncbi:MAG: tRNA epoxyqueuosine(34) reductase QueG [Gammaproteobacteria bacterium]|nr:tRNA epoxyqueuosine(34) reductase QueG [Rhodocyclaceae bacterium]MBU3910438.1 tRNA epoxyqueuosine(34) reductase QueG [Gammaproteobacteria bacterium]MBU3989048.1 tRNA epoxyqueuosine(34) reductase QueG [Gammaproteobacteria bacterium]MBU4004919.1 tRNA epoxyqueuosine(34) reductase QueG [Gammaproteobacteria bacterium]MBU4020512.1 tRNA epoxyqueuosine(34) reductase QueG [Gammaproteobacteria bacterium]